MAFAEIQEENTADLSTFFETGLLTRQGFSFEDLLQIQLLEIENPALSIADCSCLYLSKKVAASLLTGDAALPNKTILPCTASYGCWMKLLPVA
ncbi:MAG: hypothetical protein ACNY01_13405 [Desulfobacteria bacterium]